MTEMVEVRVFYDGTVEIEDTDSNHATQHLYITRKDKSGEMYICEKDKVNEYKELLITQMKRLKKNKINCKNYLTLSEIYDIINIVRR